MGKYFVFRIPSVEPERVNRFGDFFSPRPVFVDPERVANESGIERRSAFAHASETNVSVNCAGDSNGIHSEVRIESPVFQTDYGFFREFRNRFCRKGLVPEAFFGEDFPNFRTIAVEKAYGIRFDGKIERKHVPYARETEDRK